MILRLSVVVIHWHTFNRIAHWKSICQSKFNLLDWLIFQTVDQIFWIKRVDNLCRTISSQFNPEEDFLQDLQGYVQGMLQWLQEKVEDKTTPHHSYHNLDDYYILDPNLHIVLSQMDFSRYFKLKDKSKLFKLSLIYYILGKKNH
jgi:hypothetical protein